MRRLNYMQTCKIGNVTVGEQDSIKIMGIINASPESFYSRSYIPPENIFDKACELIDAGADIIDIGARSTALNSQVITQEEEIERMQAALKDFCGSEIPISIDTMYPDVLKSCLKYDISCINDIHGLYNTEFASIAADSGLPAILMASYQEPGDPVGADAIYDALEVVSDRAELFGIDNYILDPAVGRWTEKRNSENDWEICKRFDEFLELDHPLLAAVSRKTFIGDHLMKPTEERLYGTLGVTYELLKKGASIVRTHDVASTKDLIDVFLKLN